MEWHPWGARAKTARGGAEPLGLTHMEAQRGVWWMANVWRDAGSEKHRGRVPCARPVRKVGYFPPPGAQFFMCSLTYGTQTYWFQCFFFWPNVTLRTQDVSIAQLWNWACMLF